MVNLFFGSSRFDNIHITQQNHGKNMTNEVFNTVDIKEKLHNGSLYLPGDEELAKEQTICLERLYDFNKTRPLGMRKE